MKQRLSNSTSISYFHCHRFNKEHKSRRQMHHGCKPLQAQAANSQPMNSCLSDLQTLPASKNTKYAALFINTHQHPSALKDALLAMAGIFSSQNIELLGGNGKILTIPQIPHLHHSTPCHRSGAAEVPWE